MTKVFVPGNCLGFCRDNGFVFIFDPANHQKKLPFPDGRTELPTHVRKEIMFHTLASCMAAVAGLRVSKGVERIGDSCISFVVLLPQ